MTSSARGNNPDTGKQELATEHARGSVEPDRVKDSGVARNDREPPHSPDRIYRFGRLGRLVGKLIGGEGRRTSARDTDPGL